MSQKVQELNKYQTKTYTKKLFTIFFVYGTNNFTIPMRFSREDRYSYPCGMNDIFPYRRRDADTEDTKDKKYPIF